MTSPKISIIVPAYNSAATIERCIRSIINQTFKDWELIVIDNASTDGTFEVVNTLSHSDDRIRLQSENKKGVSNARNRGLDVANGEYLCFVDSDDTVEPNYLEEFYRYSSNDLVVCGYYVDYYDMGKKVRSDNHLPESVKWDSTIAKDSLLPTFANGYIHICCNKLFKRSIIEKFDLRFKPYPVNEDYIFIMKYLLYADSICVLNKPLYHWIRVANTTTGVNSIPSNLLSIYNESHQLTRDFFQDNTIADKIAFYSYEMIVYKYYDAFAQGRISKVEMNEKLKELCSNSLVQNSYSSYVPVSRINKFLVNLLADGHYRIHYFLTQKVLKHI